MMAEILVSTNLPGLPAPARGKVRDIYDLGDRLLIVVTDRISAYDCVLPTGIPRKGRVLNLLSAFWFERLAHLCPNHYLSVDAGDILTAVASAGASPPADAFGERAMLVRKARPFPVEFVVRGHLEGSAWKEYRASGSVCG